MLVVGGYYPMFSATGNCMAKISSHFSEETEVRVISEQKRINEPERDQWNNQRIKRIATKRDIRRMYLVNQGNKGLLFLHKAYWFINFLISKGGLDNTLVNMYYKTLEDEYQIREFECLLPCCMPIEAVVASYWFKKNHNNVKLIPVLYDLYSDSDIYFRNEIIKKFKKNAAQKLENKIFDYADAIFYVDNWKTYFETHKYNYSVLIEHPLIERNECVAIPLKNPSKINVVYQGEVNYEIRNPSKALNILSKILNGDSKHLIGLHFFAYGNAYGEIEKFAEKYNQRIELYGKVPKEVADGYASSADIYIIFANANSFVIPSKIYECISSGKPIMYFTSNTSDSVCKLLCKYRNKIIIDNENIDEEMVPMIYGWIIENAEKRIGYSDLDPFFEKGTPTYVARLIEEKIYGNK